MLQACRRVGDALVALRKWTNEVCRVGFFVRTVLQTRLRFGWKITCPLNPVSTRSV